MATTVNGWPVIPDNDTTGPLPRLRKAVIPGTGRHIYVRDGACGFVLIHCALWFDEAVEALDKTKVWDEWGWAVRPVRGQTTGFSNHAGGVAVDLNATLHPRGIPASRNFSPAQIRKIERRMRFYRGLIIWGGKWRTPDPMHFELADTSLPKVEKLAKRLMLTPRGRRILKANPGWGAVIKS